MMRVLVAHNHYRQPGGEDTVARQEADLLKARGHQVIEYQRSNSEIASAGITNKIRIASRTLWATDSRRELAKLIESNDPHVAHFHNTFPLISPSAYQACRDADVAVVQTLHNYRLLCPAATLFRDGKVCEECTGRILPAPAVRHNCYRDSRAETSVVALMLSLHRLRRTWHEQVDVYIALTEFARGKFIEAGLPAEKIVVKPNFVFPDPGRGDGGGDYALFVGRLTPEKGVGVMLKAWERLDGRTRLKIVGDGPLRDEVARASRETKGVEWLGQQSKDRVLALMKDARFLLFPSIWYEGFPMVIAEAYAVGLPVVASDIGSMSSLIDPNLTGLHFLAGDAADLAAQIERLLDDPAQLANMRREARGKFVAEYAAGRNYEMLMNVYDFARERVAAAKRSVKRRVPSLTTEPRAVATGSKNSTPSRTAIKPS